MDELSLLRRVRTEIPDRSPAEIAQGRAALFTAIEDEGASRLPRKRGVHSGKRAAAWTGFSALGAASLAAVLVAVNVGGGVPGVDIGGAEPAAASVLESAAAATLEFSDPVVGPGQFLRVETNAVFLAQGSITGDSELTGFLERYHDELFVPANRDDEWVYVQCVRTPDQTFGPESEAFARFIAEQDAGYDVDAWRSFPGGITPSGPFAGYNTRTGTAVDFAALPQDPEQLLQTIYEINVGAVSPEDQALVWIGDTLRRGTVPADFRAALYETAALIPGIEITDEQATLNGVTGVAVGRVGLEGNQRQDIVLDPATGRFIGERQVFLETIGGIPAGTTVASTAVTTTIVDAAPTDATLCENYR